MMYRQVAEDQVTPSLKTVQWKPINTESSSGNIQGKKRGKNETR